MNTTLPTLKQECLAEFLGTGLFLFLGISCLAAMKLAAASFGLWEICIVWGLSVALGVYLTAGISGGHLNPAVTIALWLFGNFSAHKVLPYILCQIMGAFGGAMVVSCFTTICLLIMSWHTIFNAAAWTALHRRVFSRRFPIRKLICFRLLPVKPSER